MVGGKQLTSKTRQRDNAPRRPAMSMNKPDIEQIQRAVATSLHEHWVLFLVEGIILVILAGRRRYSADRHARGRNPVWLALSDQRNRRFDHHLPDAPSAKNPTKARQASKGRVHKGE